MPDIKNDDRLPPCAICGAPIPTDAQEDDDLCAVCEMNEQAHLEWERDRD